MVWNSPLPNSLIRASCLCAHRPYTGILYTCAFLGVSLQMKCLCLKRVWSEVVRSLGCIASVWEMAFRLILSRPCWWWVGATSVSHKRLPITDDKSVFGYLAYTQPIQRLVTHLCYRSWLHTHASRRLDFSNLSNCQERTSWNTEQRKVRIKTTLPQTAETSRWREKERDS